MKIKKKKKGRLRKQKRWKLEQVTVRAYTFRYVSQIMIIFRNVQQEHDMENYDHYTNKIFIDPSKQIDRQTFENVRIGIGYHASSQFFILFFKIISPRCMNWKIFGKAIIFENILQEHDMENSTLSSH